MSFSDFVIASMNGKFVFLFCLLYVCYAPYVSGLFCNVSTIQSCPAALYYVPNTVISHKDVVSLFQVISDDVNRMVDGFLINIRCSCLPDHDEFTVHVDYKVEAGDTWESISSKFGSLVVERHDKVLFPSRVVTLDVLCGCFGSDVSVTYKIKAGDTLYMICSLFGSDLNETVTLNRIENPAMIYAGDVLYIPEPKASLEKLTKPGGIGNDKEKRTEKQSEPGIRVAAGIIVAVITLLLLIVIIVVWRNRARERSLESKSLSWRRECVHCYLDAPCPYHESRASEDSRASSFSSDRASVLPYNEIREATSNFSIYMKIGQGSYGSVYKGKLRGNEAAIKQMKTSKSKEFTSELNILCRVHHTSLIRLIGYAAGGDSLFLVYEFAKNGTLSDHLHSPTSKGYRPLTWTTRVQIALDAAKGLEYIHEHTNPLYVHRDVKTNNILLDSNFRAKIADFGLVKLLECSPGSGTTASRIVGTIGYLAPEYVRDGCVTTKNDVYSFGVVLMELITGQLAIIKDSSSEKDQHSEHRTLVQYMLSIVSGIPDDFTRLTKCIDPNLSRYNKDLVFQMALLAKDCVDENWNQRPDMSRVVLKLSHILAHSKKWEERERYHLLRYSYI